MTPSKVGLVQMRSCNDVDENFACCSSLVCKAVGQGAQLVCFPECFSFMGAAPGEAQRIAQTLDGPVMRKYCALARSKGVWLSLGGFQECDTISCGGQDAAGANRGVTGPLLSGHARRVAPRRTATPPTWTLS